MPLYPLIISFFSKLFFFIPPPWVGLILSYIFFISSFIYLIKLFSLDFTKKQTYNALLFLLVFPTSFFFWTVYSESLFLLLTVSAIYFARNKNWKLAAFCGFLASLTRIVGFLIIIPLLFEYYSHYKKKLIADVYYLFCIPLGTALYAAYNYFRWGNPLLFIQAHSQLSNGRSATALVFFPQTLWRYFKILSTVSISLWEWKIALLEVVSFLFACAAIYLLWKMKVRVSYLVYAITTLFVPASSGTFTGLPRYIIVIFPFFLLFAHLKNKVLIFGLLFCSLILQFLLYVYFSLGYYVA